MLSATKTRKKIHNKMCRMPNNMLAMPTKIPGIFMPQVSRPVLRKFKVVTLIKANASLLHNVLLMLLSRQLSHSVHDCGGVYVQQKEDAFAIVGSEEHKPTQENGTNLGDRERGNHNH